MIDLDDLERVNDTQGHAAGDLLLRRTAEVLSRTPRPTDVVARPGGDEFPVLAVELDGDGVRALANRIQDRLMDAGISASVAGVPHTGGRDLVDTWKRADLAMYANKQARRERVRGTSTVAAGWADTRPPGDALLFRVDPAVQAPEGLVHVSGELDVSTAPSLLALVTDLITIGYRRISLDVLHMRFCDVGGPRALEASQQRLHALGGSLTVLQPCWSLRLLMDTFDLIPMLSTRTAAQVGP